MMRVSVDITFFKNEFLRMSVPLLRTIDLDALQIFKAVSPRFAPMSPPRRAVSFPLHLSSEQTSFVPSVPPSPYRLLRYSGSHLSMPCCVLGSRTRAQKSNHRVS